MARAATDAQKVFAVAVDRQALARTHTGTFGIADARIAVPGGRLTAARQFGGGVGIDGPGMIEIELGKFPRQPCGIGESGMGVGKGVASDGQSRLHRLFQGLCGKVGSGGAASGLSHVDGDAQAFVAVILDGFHLAESDTHGQPFAAAGRRFRSRRPGLAGEAERLFDDGTQFGGRG